jgi:hypothetical protein
VTNQARRLRSVLAGLIVLVVLAFLTAYLSTWKTPASTQATLVEEQAPEVSGQLLVYVNDRLAYRGQVHSFLKPVTTMLALGLFPVSGFRSASVVLAGEAPSTWSAYYGAGTFTTTFQYGGAESYQSVWGMYASIAPLLLVYDTKGSKWTEVTLSTTPSITSNATGVLLTISGSVTPSLSSATNVSMIRLVRPTGSPNMDPPPHAYFAVRIAEDTISPAVTVNPGDSLTVVYQFYFKSNQLFTKNWANTFFVWLYNVPSAKINVTVTDGTTDYIDPYSGATLYPNNAPVNTYIVVGDGSASFSRTAYKVVSEIARAEPSVQVYGGGVSLSYTFTFSKDTTVTEVAVYTRLRDGKDVMLLYYVLPAPVTAKAGAPFTVTFYINLPYQDRV